MESWMGPGAFAARYAEQPPRHPPMPASGGNRRLSTHRHAGASPGTTPMPNWGTRDRPATRGWFAQSLWRTLVAN